MQAAHSDARIESKTSLEDGNNGKFERRRSVADLSDVNEKIVDLTQRLVALEKAFCSKTSIDDRNPEKLPLIKRPNRIKEKDPSITNYPEKAVINKKDIHELKGDL